MPHLSGAAARTSTMAEPLMPLAPVTMAVYLWSEAGLGNVGRLWKIPDLERRVRVSAVMTMGLTYSKLLEQLKIMFLSDI